MDLSTVISLVGNTLLILGVMYFSGGLLMYWDLISLVIVLGGAFLGTLLRFPISGFLSGIRASSICFFDTVQDANELVEEIIELAKTARQNSILGLEKVTIGNRFLQKAVNFMVDGYDPEVIDQILRLEKYNMKNRHKDGKKFYDDMGEACPAFGMIGTVIGLIVIMANLSDPTKIGPGLAVALVTTLYGSLFSNMIFIPMASKLAHRSKTELANMDIIREGVNSILKGENPQAIRNRLDSFLTEAPEAG